MAPRLVQKGVPAVIAMQYSIRDETAKLFADKFYRTLALGKPVDEAVQSARNLISIQIGPDRRDFATPVLYMRARDGVILDLAKEADLAADSEATDDEGSKQVRASALFQICPRTTYHARRICPA